MSFPSKIASSFKGKSAGPSKSRSTNATASLFPFCPYQPPRGACCGGTEEERVMVNLWLVGSLYRCKIIDLSTCGHFCTSSYCFLFYLLSTIDFLSVKGSGGMILEIFLVGGDLDSAICVMCKSSVCSFLARWSQSWCLNTPETPFQEHCSIFGQP